MSINGRTCIGVYVNFPETGSYQKDFLKGVNAGAIERNYDIIVFGIGNLSSDPQNDHLGAMFLDYIGTKLLDGVIFLTGSFAQEAGLARKNSLVERSKRLPMVSVGDVIEGIPNILVDNQGGFEKMLDHVLGEHHYTRPVFVAGPITSRDSNERLDCFKKALERHSYTWSPDMVYYGAFNYEDGILAVGHFLDTKNQQPDIFICANDLMAIGVIQTLSKRRDTKDLEIAVTGYDDFPISEWCESPLTTVRQPLDKMGLLAIEMIAELLEGKPISPQVQYVPTQGVIRTTCGCPPEPGHWTQQNTILGKKLSTVQDIVLDSLLKQDQERIDDSRLSRFFREYINAKRLDGNIENEKLLMERLGCGSLYVTLFDNPDEGRHDTCHLKIAWNDHKRLGIDDFGQEHTFSQFLPHSHMPKNRFTLIVTTLEELQKSFGYLIIDYGISSTKLDLFRIHLSESIMAVSINEKLTKLNHDLRLAQTKLETLSQTDELTGLHNRRGFLAMAEHQVTYCRRQGEGIWVLFMDLDGLKKINDTFGHDEGDVAIQEFGKILLQGFRASDIIARLGGDEFTVLVAGATEDSLAIIRGRIEQLLTHANQTLQKPWHLAASIGGFYAGPSCNETLETMIAKADQELYQEKRKKKTQVPKSPIDLARR